MNEFDDVIKLFEEEIAKYIGTKYVVAVSNGTSAIHTALIASDTWADVITTPFTFIATVDPILQIGRKPIFVDIDRKTLCLDPELVQKKLEENNRISTILNVDLFGNTENLLEIRKICDNSAVKFIEDASQAFGAKVKDGRRAGSIGDVGTFSFYASKNLWTFEGGALVTDDPDIDKKARMIRNHGFDENGEKVMEGYNYKMPRLCAFIGLTNLRLHKIAIESELGMLSPKDGYYPKTVYQNKYYKKYACSCPVAEEVALKVRMKIY